MCANLDRSMNLYLDGASLSRFYQPQWFILFDMTHTFFMYPIKPIKKDDLGVTF